MSAPTTVPTAAPTTARSIAPPVRRPLPPNKFSNLFIPKKPPQVKKTGPIVSVDTTPKMPEKITLPEIDAPFVEFDLLKGDLGGKDWDIFRFKSIPGGKTLKETFTFPVKLNRKNFKYNDSDPIITDDLKDVDPTLAGASQPKTEKLVPLKGPDGTNVIGPDGQPVMVPPNMQQMKGGRIPNFNNTPKDGAKKAATGPDGQPKRKKNQKKFRQIHKIPEEKRELKRQERYPWLWEDSGKEVWEGRRQERSQVRMHLLQVCNDGSFRWYPGYKYFQFVKLPTWRIPTADEANEKFEKMQKMRNPLYFAENASLYGNGGGMARQFKEYADQLDAEEKKRVLMATGEGNTEMMIGGRMVTVVDRGAKSKFDEDDDETVPKPNYREMFGEDAGDDEHDYEDDVQDDDERIPMDGMEEEEKEYDERLKREWRLANKTDVEIPEFKKRKLTKEGKKLKKLLAGDESASDSDSDADPYVSDDLEDSEEEAKAAIEAEAEKEKLRKEEEEKAKALEKEKEAEKEKLNAIKNPAHERLKAGGNTSRAGSPKPKGGTSTNPSPTKGSRAGSPSLKGTPSTSAGGPRANSPPAPAAARAVGSQASRGSPTPNPSPAKRKAGDAFPEDSTPRKKKSVSPPTPAVANAAASNPKKRKAGDDGNATATPLPATPAPKKKKIETFDGCLSMEMVVEYLKDRESRHLKTQTKDAIERFKPMWAGPGGDSRNKELLTHWIKKVANLGEGNWLTLRK